MSQEDMKNIRLEERKTIRRYGLLFGNVVIVHETLVKDIVSKEFVVTSRVNTSTNMTKEALIADLDEKRVLINEKNQAEIDKINALE